MYILNSVLEIKSRHINENLHFFCHFETIFQEITVGGVPVEFFKIFYCIIKSNYKCFTLPFFTNVAKERKNKFPLPFAYYQANRVSTRFFENSAGKLLRFPLTPLESEFVENSGRDQHLNLQNK